jgi:hypothetical protein
LDDSYFTHIFCINFLQQQKLTLLNKENPIFAKQLHPANYFIAQGPGLDVIKLTFVEFKP